MDKYLIQVIDKAGAIIDACTFKTQKSFDAAKKSDWAIGYETTIRCWNIENVMSPVRI